MNNKNFIKERLIQGITEFEKKSVAAGVLIKCIKTDNIFLLLRNDKVPVWALMSGGIDKGENVMDGLKREVTEELSINPSDIVFKFVGIEHEPNNGREFHYYQGYSNKEFKPILDHENLQYGWFSKDNLPTPLRKGLAEKIAKI